MITFAVLLALGTLAQAKVAPRQDVRIVNGSVDLAIPNGAENAVPEANYFRAPAEPFAAYRIFPCRLQLRVFDKTRMAQSCH